MEPWHATEPFLFGSVNSLADGHNPGIQASTVHHFEEPCFREYQQSSGLEPQGIISQSSIKHGIPIS